MKFIVATLFIILTLIAKAEQIPAIEINQSAYSGLLLQIQNFKMTLKKSLPDFAKVIETKLSGESNERSRKVIEGSINAIEALSEFAKDSPFDRKKPDPAKLQSAVTFLVDLHTILYIQHFEQLAEIPKENLAAREILLKINGLLLEKLKELESAFQLVAPKLDFKGSKMPTFSGGYIDENFNEVPPPKSDNSEIKTFRGNFMLLMNLLNDPKSYKPYNFSLTAKAEGLISFMTGWGKIITTQAETVEVRFTHSKNEATGQYGIDPNSLSISVLSSSEHKNMGEGIELMIPETRFKDKAPPYNFFPNGQLIDGLEYTSPSWSDNCIQCRKVLYQNGKLTIVDVRQHFAVKLEFDGTNRETTMRTTRTAIIDLNSDLSAIRSVSYEAIEETLSSEGKYVNPTIKSKAKSKGPLEFLMKSFYAGGTEVYSRKPGNEFIPFEALGNFTGIFHRTELHHVDSFEASAVMKLLRPADAKKMCKHLF